MPPWFFPALLGLSAIVTMVCGVWLLAQLAALAHVFADNADISRPRASRRTFKRVLGGFLGGGLVSIATLIVVVTGLASALTV